jgi:hypothetical protein
MSRERHRERENDIKIKGMTVGERESEKQSHGWRGMMNFEIDTIINLIAKKYKQLKIKHKIRLLSNHATA